MRTRTRPIGICSFVLFSLLSLGISRAFAHCDTMNGPVVTAARHALETADPAGVLIWIRKEDEPEIRDAFAKTLAVRKLGPEAQRLADFWFFETLVRVHRAGEGVAYTGLKPTEQEIDPGISAADEAIERGSSGVLVNHLTESVANGVQKRFSEVLERKKFKPQDIEGGRRYVASYVEFLHYVERLHQAAAGSHGHSAEERSGSRGNHDE